ncbi:hypothetical protein CERSUDRAFT_60729 [Gelatoporia subvermispora B]|uniref:Zn(2)-C6 fungal-type domain-containing protein n=1 Tax=Ceriporiopsis subvermispora (strain B) TaxID=914234 RepID=M2QYA4_CERS8|nr:hypothetical protein CERSUDRAFT_60729 [Gelatoporia subvermispora B]
MPRITLCLSEFQASAGQSSGQERYPSDEDGDSPVVRVKKRTPMACQFCRGRKLKCDGRQTCANCQRRNIPCVYTPV